MLDKYLIVPFVLSAIIIAVPIYYFAYAQTPQIEKRFSSCVTSVPELDLKTYVDGRPLSYDVTGCPIQNVIIHNWNNVSPVEKTSITSVLSGKGLSEKEEYDSNALQAVVANSK